MRNDTISILDGSTFVVSNRAGDVDAAPDQAHGLFFKDTRHLSRWILEVDGKSPDVLSTDDVEYYYAQFFLAPKTGTIYTNPYLSLMRRRLVGDGFVEEITVFNHGATPADVSLRLRIGSDFADLFEVKDALKKKGSLYREVATDRSCSDTGARTSSARRASRPMSPRRSTTRVCSSTFASSPGPNGGPASPSSRSWETR